MVDQTLQSYANQAAAHFNIPSQIFNSLIQTESSWNPAAVSSAGAIGLTQLMPGTAAELGVDPNDPAQNIVGGAAYLSRLFGQFGNWNDALAAYNAGPGNIQAGQTYAAKVLAGAQQQGYIGAGFASGQNAASQQASANAPGWFSIQNFLGLGDISFTNLALYAVAIGALGVVGYFGIKSLFQGALNGPVQQKG